MSESDQQGSLQAAQEKKATGWFLPALCLPVLCVVVYMAGLGGFFMWEESARTNAEFIRRMEIRNKVYAPLIWLKAHDSTGAVRAVVLWEHSLFHNKAFDPSRLP